MTLADDKNRDCLNYRLIGAQDELGSWGHEYVRYNVFAKLAPLLARTQTTRWVGSHSSSHF